MLIGRWHVDIFPLGWFLIGLFVLVVLAVFGLLGWRVFQEFKLAVWTSRG
jgi:predicted negative regulator of RcsB-dependent stress response